MKLHTTFYLLILFFVNSGCNKKADINIENLIEINIIPSQKDDFYDIADEILPEFSIISLETTQDCLLGYIRKIISTEKLFYIQDNMNACIFLFDKEGKFVSKLDKRGNGPDEYINISSFIVKDDNIWIYDDMRGKLVCYNENLNKTHEVDAKIPTFDITFLKNNIFLATNWFSYGNNSYQLKKYDLDTQKVTEYYPFSDLGNENLPVMKTTQFAKLNDTCLFICSYDNIIYEITENEVKGKYKFIFSNRYEDKPLTNHELMSESNYIRGIDGIEQTLQNIILKYEDKGMAKMAIYNKSSQKTNIYSRVLVNSKFGDLQSYRYFIMNNNEIISLYDPDVIINYGSELFNMEKMPDNELKRSFNSILSNLNSGDNPIILTYKLKESSTL